MVDLDRKTIAKIGKLLPMLSSNHAGEVVATAAAIQRTLEIGGGCLHDLVAMISKPPQVVEKVVYRDRVVVEEKIVYRDRPAQSMGPNGMSGDYVQEVGLRLLANPALGDRERDFVENMVARAELDGRAFTMTAKQQIWFRELAARHREPEAARG